LSCSTAAYNNLGAVTPSTTASDTTFTANRTYCYRVIATNPAGSFISAGVKITIPAAPAAPTNAVISNVVPTSLTFGWTLSAGTVVPTGYEVQQCAGSTLTGNCAVQGAGWTPLGTVSATTSSYNVTGLSAGTLYWFRVRAYNPLTSVWLNSTAAVAYPVAIADIYTATANTIVSQSVTGNVLTNDLPTGATGRTVTNVSAVQHTTGGGTSPATATVTMNTTTGAFTMTLTSPPANNTTTLRQTSKRGTYVFTYTETFGGITSAPVTATLTVN
jgi:hypothetical protein